MSAIRVSVVLPVHNQADQIATIIDTTRQALAGVDGPCELVLVVNGCRDSTLAVCRRAAADTDDVVVIESDAGWGAAVIAGLKAARGDVLCYTNSARVAAADLQLALRYGQVNDGAVVKASRKLRERMLRRAGSVIYNLECRSLFGLAVWDINGTPKVFHRVLLPTLALTESGDLIDLELVVHCKRAGIPVVEVPVYETRRLSGKATTNLMSALRMYSRPFAMRRRDRARTAAAQAGTRD